MFSKSIHRKPFKKIGEGDVCVVYEVCDESSKVARIHATEKYDNCDFDCKNLMQVGRLPNINQSR